MKIPVLSMAGCLLCSIATAQSPWPIQLTDPGPEWLRQSNDEGDVVLFRTMPGGGKCVFVLSGPRVALLGVDAEIKLKWQAVAGPKAPLPAIESAKANDGVVKGIETATNAAVTPYQYFSLVYFAMSSFTQRVEMHANSLTCRDPLSALFKTIHRSGAAPVVQARSRRPTPLAVNECINLQSGCAASCQGLGPVTASACASSCIEKAGICVKEQQRGK